MRARRWSSTLLEPALASVSLSLCLGLLAGCPGAADHGGTLRSCFGIGVDDPGSRAVPSGEGGWLLEGLRRVDEPTSPDFNVTGCEEEPTEVIELEDDEGVRVWLGFTVRTAAGDDVTPPPSVGTGSLRLRARTQVRWGIDDASFTLVEDGALVLAGAHGLRAFSEEDLPGLEVSAGGGSTLLPAVWPCGMTRPITLRFAAEDEVTLANDATGVVTTSAGPLTVRNVSSSQTDLLASCEDVSTGPDGVWFASR